MATLKEKIGYALGDAAAGGITWKIMSIAFPLFFTNVFGLTVADTATLMLIARMFDVVTDPLMGSLADRTQSRWGTYRPWLIFGAIPFGLIFALLLFTPEFGPVGKRIYAYSLYLLMMAMYTAVNVPYGSLLGVMTNDDNEKNQFSSYRMVGAYAMGFITLFTFPYIIELIGGEKLACRRHLYHRSQTASICCHRCHLWHNRCCRHIGLRATHQREAETRQGREILVQAVRRSVQEQTLDLPHPHWHLHQLLQWFPLCRGRLSDGILSPW